MTSSRSLSLLPPHVQHWVENLRQLPLGHFTTELNIEGYRLSISAEAQSQLQWITAKLAPMTLNDQVPTVRRTTLNIISDCFLSAQLHDFLVNEKIGFKKMPVKAKRTWHLPITQHLDLCCSPTHGILWLFDRENSAVTMITSPRTRFPISEAHSTVRTLVVSHLHDQGWHTFHAGAVFAGNAVRLIIGNSGQGKTSLILALASAGAGLVANERILLKTEGGIIRAMPFPMPVLVGLGTAMQYPGIDINLDHSELLLSFPGRFDRSNLKKTPRNKWSELADKIPLLSTEIDRIFPKGKCHPGGRLEGVILPRLTSGAQHNVTQASYRDVRNAVKRNYLPHTKEKHYQDWMPFGFMSRTEEDADKIIGQLSEHPGAKVTFFEPGNAEELLRNTLNCLAN